jgi:hypothetical protein
MWRVLGRRECQVVKPGDRDHFEDLSKDRRIILKRIFKKSVER